MKSENILREKSYQFALRIIKLYQYLSKKRQEYVLAKQVLRSGTSIGANIEEANQAESTADFIHKLAIANKGANETQYWLRLLNDSNILEEKLAISLIEDCNEVIKILTSSLKTVKKRRNLITGFSLLMGITSITLISFFLIN
ncbi:MAG: four helix bundle protein [Verrucomicrobia bacterium]|nr:four helix bundle protein [Cytophagales bacterium]